MTSKNEITGLTPYAQKAKEFFQKICGAISRESFTREFLLMTFPKGIKKLSLIKIRRLFRKGLFRMVCKNMTLISLRFTAEIH
jgi:hypothetical protein